jgi:alkylated DNA repair dioxygenase AlkB
MYQKPLLYELQPYPEGFSYSPDFLSESEEKDLLCRFKDVSFRPYVYEGYEAKRQIKSFTKDAGYPEFLLPILQRTASYFGFPVESIHHSMITEYAPGTQLGWHRDMPPYDKVMGISLGSAVPFRFRRKTGKTWERITLIAERRSLYSMSGPARYEWQHSIPPVEDWRYSITLRTVQYG